MNLVGTVFMKAYTAYFFYVFFIFVSTETIVSGQAKINWMSWEEVELKSKKEPKKILIDVYTDWCRFCKKLQEGTLCDDNIINYINANYYPVKFNAETKENIEFNGKTYKHTKTGKHSYNELALELTKGKLSYPALIFMDSEYKVIQAIHGYMEAPKLEIIITYFSEDHHLKTPWVTYQKNYIPMAAYTKGN